MSSILPKKNYGTEIWQELHKARQHARGGPSILSELLLSPLSFLVQSSVLFQENQIMLC